MGYIKDIGAVLNVRAVLNFDRFKEICMNGNLSNNSFDKTRTRNGKEMVDWKCENSSGDSISTLLNFNSVKNEVVIEPFKLQSRDFIDGRITSDFIDTLESLVKECKGDLSGYDTDYKTYLMVEGKSIPSDFSISKEGTNSEVNIENEDEDESMVNYKVNVSVKEFLTSNPNIAAELKTLGCNTFEEKLNALGKKLIQLKLQEEISYTLFVDLFRQCGLLGATDPTVVRFYKLLT